jgi:hypothetical protein
LFGFVYGLLAGLGAESHAGTGSETRVVMVEKGSLDDGGAVAQFAETHFCGDYIFLKDLMPLVKAAGRRRFEEGMGRDTVPHSRQITFPEAVSSSIFVGFEHT